MNSFWETFLRKDLPPHGHCYLWDDNLVALHVISDALITLSYLTIPFALIYLVIKRDDLHFNYMFVMFGIFIFACGLTHLTNIYNVWNGAYWVSGAVKAVTAAASVGTAILVWPLIPKALAMPSNETLRQVNSDLQAQSDLAIKQSRDLETLSRRLAELVEERNLELAELKHVKAELERSNNALQQFAYIASHDLKEPLRTINSFGQLLKRSASEKLGEKDNQLVDFMTDAAGRMTEQLEALRNYASVGQKFVAPERVDLNEVCEQLVSDLATTIESSKATINLAPLEPVMMNRPHAQPLLQNLISNAIKFCPPDRSAVIDIGPLPPGKAGEAGFYIRDNGIGIDPQYFDKIFGVFERLHGMNDYEGTGIGLAICQKIVESNHGRIEVESTPGEGTEFRIYLPHATATMEA